MKKLTEIDEMPCKCHRQDINTRLSEIEQKNIKDKMLCKYPEYEINRKLSDIMVINGREMIVYSAANGVFNWGEKGSCEFINYDIYLDEL